MSNLILVVLCFLEVVFFIRSIVKKKNCILEKCVVRVVLFLGFILLLFTSIFTFGFRYYGILTILVIQILLGSRVLFTKKQKPYSGKKIVFILIGNMLLYLLGSIPIFLFPDYKPIKATGEFTINTSSYRWTDVSRAETFAEEGNRFVDVAFWYPNEPGSYPLILFSHGAFGFNGTNQSTFENLASHGYVVASIGHPYHAFYTKSPEGKTVLANIDFVNSVYAVNAMEDGLEKQAITDQWMELRTSDIQFTIDTIISQTIENPSDELFSKINPEKIGLFGHSLGGAAVASVGRNNSNIDAVIVLDGTMIGEVLGYDQESIIFEEQPYPLPILNIYASSHYDEALLYGTMYHNFHMANNSEQAYRAVLADSGHMNFTDLPLFSPILGKALGTGTVDARYAIETTNTWVLNFFDYVLKGDTTYSFEKDIVDEGIH